MLLIEFLTKIQRIEKNRNTIIVGIDGLSASGKSTLAAKLAESDDRITIVHMDDFYLPSDERENLHPDTYG